MQWVVSLNLSGFMKTSRRALRCPPACLFRRLALGPTGTPRPVGSPGAACQRSLAEFAPAGAKKIKLVFGPGAVLMRTEDFCRRDGRVCTAASVGACRGQPSAGRLLDGGVTREGGPHQFNLKMLDGLQNRPTSPKSVQTNAGPGCREAAGAVSCEGDCKPGSVSDSHLSRRAVANAFKPPPKDGRAGHLSFPRCCSG